jgi:hypothetical protein
MKSRIPFSGEVWFRQFLNEYQTNHNQIHTQFTSHSKCKKLLGNKFN